MSVLRHLDLTRPNQTRAPQLAHHSSTSSGGTPPLRELQPQQVSSTMLPEASSDVHTCLRSTTQHQALSCLAMTS